MKKEVPNAPVFIVSGAEDLARKQAIHAIAERFLDPGFGDFDCDNIEGADLNAQAALSAWQTIPVASARRVVIVRNLDDASSGEIAKLTARIASPTPKGCLILETASDSGKEMSALLKAGEKAGVLVTCGAAKPEDARAFVTQTSEEMGVRLDPAAAQEIIRRLGPNFWQLATEIQKMASYVYPETLIRKVHIEEMIPEPPEDRIFAMIDAICEGRAAAATDMLRDLFRAGDDERGTAHRTLAVLTRHFRLLWQARVLRDAGFSFREGAVVPEGAAQWLPASPNLLEALKRTPFLMNKYRSQSERFNMRALAAAFDVLSDCDLALKGRSASVGDAYADLEMCLWRITRLPPPVSQNRPSCSR
ncbi:MAG: DNA polymerase III subunit delta [Armatimonadota bacterium]